MTLTEAFTACRNGDFVSHTSFDNNQSLHEYKYTLYYEDGADLINHIDWLHKQPWSKDGWYVKFTKDQVDKEKLDKLHKENSGYMLRSGSYEDCIMR